MPGQENNSNSTELNPVSTKINSKVFYLIGQGPGSPVSFRTEKTSEIRRSGKHQLKENFAGGKNIIHK